MGQPQAKGVRLNRQWNRKSKCSLVYCLVIINSLKMCLLHSSHFVCVYLCIFFPSFLHSFLWSYIDWWHYCDQWWVLNRLARLHFPEFSLGSRTYLAQVRPKYQNFCSQNVNRLLSACATESRSHQSVIIVVIFLKSNKIWGSSHSTLSLRTVFLCSKPLFYSQVCLERHKTKYYGNNARHGLMCWYLYLL